MDWVLPLVTLTGMEIILGIDNIIFLSILTGSVPVERRRMVRYIGLGLALGARMGLLAGVKWVMGLSTPLFHLSSLKVLPAAWLHSHQVDAITGRDLVLLGGGLFLIAKSVLEIHKRMEPKDDENAHVRTASSLAGVLAQIIVLDLVFSLDSVIAAIGMAQALWIMLVAMSVAVAFMAVFAGKISRFVEENPTFKMLALSFLVLIGIVLIAEGIGSHIDRGYIYGSMVFALVVELLNMRAQRKRAKRAKRASRRSGSVAVEPRQARAQSVV